MTTVVVTNAPSAARYATFLIANVAHSKARVFPSYYFEIRSAKWRSELLPPHAFTAGTNMVGCLPSGERILAPGESFTVTVALPFDDQEWRAMIRYKALLTQASLHTDTWLSYVGLGVPSWPEYSAYTDSNLK